MRNGDEPDGAGRRISAGADSLRLDGGARGRHRDECESVAGARRRELWFPRCGSVAAPWILIRERSGVRVGAASPQLADVGETSPLAVTVALPERRLTTSG